VKFVANYGVRAGQKLSPMGGNEFFCCQRFNVSTDNMLHRSAADIMKHCQSEGTAEFVTLATVLFKLLCIRDGSYSTEFGDDVITDYIHSTCR